MGVRHPSDTSDLACRENGVEEETEGRVRLTAMLDGKSKQHDMTGADSGLHDRGAAGDHILAFEPTAQQQIAGAVMRHGVHAG